jgi:hypothetical protein
MNIFKKLFSKKSEEEENGFIPMEHPWETKCSCKDEGEDDTDVLPIIKLYNEMYCLAATITDSEIEEGDVLAKDRSTEISTHMKRMMFLYAEGGEELEF